MTTVNIHEAKTHLSRLLAAVQRGEEVVIARAGEPIATLTAYKPPRRKVAAPGSLEGQGWMADDFNASVDDLFDVLKDDEASAANATPVAAPGK